MQTMEKGISTMDIEFESIEAIRAYQEDLLRKQIAYLASHSPYYKRLFAKEGIDPESIRTIDDLQRVPFTEKADLQRHNDDFLCVPREDIVDYITTSGTLGDPVLFGCTEADLQRLAYWMGIRRMGASIIRVGNGIPELQWDTIQRLHPTAIMCVPSFILRLIEYAEQHHIDYRHSSIRKIIGIGEGLRDQQFQLNLLGQRIHDKWPEVELYATYSSTEMSATFSECEHACGGHVHPELIIVEIVGEDDQPVEDGQPGEIVITTLGVEGMPLLRFRTGDIAAKVTAPCACGRNSYRLTPLIGRKHNMIKLKGTTIYPPAINDVLDNTDFVGNYVVVVRPSDAGTDEVIVRISLKPHTLSSEEAVKTLKDHFRSRLRVAPLVEILPADVIQQINFPAKSRKPIKFIDER